MMGEFTVQILLGSLSSPGGADTSEEGKDGVAYCCCIHQYTCAHALLYIQISNSM